MVSDREVMDSLLRWEDPEMKLTVTELGLIYAVKVEGSHAETDTDTYQSWVPCCT